MGHNNQIEDNEKWPAFLLWLFLGDPDLCKYSANDGTHRVPQIVTGQSP